MEGPGGRRRTARALEPGRVWPSDLSGRVRAALRGQLRERAVPSPHRYAMALQRLSTASSPWGISTPRPSTRPTRSSGLDAPGSSAPAAFDQGGRFEPRGRRPLRPDWRSSLDRSSSPCGSSESSTSTAPYSETCGGPPGRSKVLRFYVKYHLSDHRPLWTELKV